MPPVAHLCEHLYGIRIGQFMLIAQRGIERAVEEESAVNVEKLITVSSVSRQDTQQGQSSQ
jgi:hypothetical protein